MEVWRKFSDVTFVYNNRLNVTPIGRITLAPLSGWLPPDNINRYWQINLVSEECFAREPFCETKRIGDLLAHLHVDRNMGRDYLCGAALSTI